MKKKQSFYKRKKTIALLLFIISLISIRFYLPFLIKNAINKSLSEIEGYSGEVEDIDIALYRGAYKLKNLKIKKISAHSKIPFLYFPHTDIAIQWKPLIKGNIVCKIDMQKPKISYVIEDHELESEVNPTDWTNALEGIVPIDINKLTINDGVLELIQINANPDIDLKITSFNLMMDNISIANDIKETLPSTLTINGNVLNGGKLIIEGKMNVIKKIPEMDVSLSLESVPLVSLNNACSYYASIDFEKGNFDCYSELAIADSKIKGYVKPMFNDIKFRSKGEKLKEKLWEGFIGTANYILKNHHTNTLATKVPLEGELSQIESNVWVSIYNLFKNGWVKAFEKHVDNSINFGDVLELEKTTSKKEK
jgi:hypothetical protein